MSEQQETVHIHIKSLGRAVEFPVRSAETCKKCKGTGKGQKNGRKLLSPIFHYLISLSLRNRFSV